MFTQQTWGERVKAERADHAQKARAICAQAKDDGGRDFTKAELAEVQGHLDAVEEIDVAVRSAEKADGLMNHIEKLGPPPAAFADGSGGGLFTENQKDGFVHAARTKGNFAADVPIKAATFSGGLLPSAGVLALPSPIGTGAYPLRDLFSKAEAPGPTIRYYQMGAGTSAVVAEGGLKPDAGASVTAKDASLIKLASTFQISDELREDADFLMGAITREVVTGTLRKENEQIVTALTTSGVLTATGTTAEALDVVATAIGGQEAINGVTPGALILNPADLAALRKAKASTGGTYFIDPLAAAPSAVHGVPLVSTPAVTVGTMFLLSQGAGIFYQRGGLRIESGYNADDWSKNLMTVRVEERILPAIVRPGLITKITLT